MHELSRLPNSEYYMRINRWLVAKKIVAKKIQLSYNSLYINTSIPIEGQHSPRVCSVIRRDSFRRDTHLQCVYTLQKSRPDANVSITSDRCCGNAVTVKLEEFFFQDGDYRTVYSRDITIRSTWLVFPYHHAAFCLHNGNSSRRQQKEF